MVLRDQIWWTAKKTKWYIYSIQFAVETRTQVWRNHLTEIRLRQTKKTHFKLNQFVKLSISISQCLPVNNTSCLLNPKHRDNCMFES